MPPEKEPEKKIASIHTLESDLASAVNDKDYGKNIIKIITNPDKRIYEPENSKPKFSISFENFFSKRTFFYLIGLLLLIVIFIIMYIFYKANNVEEYIGETVATSTVATTTQNPIINSNNILNSEIIQSSDFSKLNRFELISEINKIKETLIAKKINPNNNISINTNITNTQFFEKIRYSGGEGLLRSLKSNYAFGLYSIENDNFETYLLIEVDNFDLAFKSILEWERYIPVDLKDIFIGNNIIKTASSINNAATTSSSTTQVQNIKYIKKNTIGFVDRILKNQDIREYVNNENNINIIYGFINNKYLLITSGETSFIDIRDRLLKENIVR
jgi:hypothetical protein